MWWQNMKKNFLRKGIRSINWSQWRNRRCKFHICILYSYSNIYQYPHEGRENAVRWKKSWKICMREKMYRMPGINRRLMCIRCSFDEVYRILNTGFCHGEEKEKRCRWIKWMISSKGKKRQRFGSHRRITVLRYCHPICLSWWNFMHPGVGNAPWCRRSWSRSRNNIRVS